MSKTKYLTMMVNLPKYKGEKIKVEKTRDYYNVFLSILKVENEKVRNTKHYWVMGIDKKGYVVCVYIFAIDPKKLMKISLKKIYRIAIMLNAVEVVLAYNVREDEPLEPLPESIAFFNKAFNLSYSMLEISTLDMMIISTKGYHSDKEEGHFDFYKKDLSFKIVNDVKNKLDEEKANAVKVGIDKGKVIGKKEGVTEGKIIGMTKEKIDMAKSMLKDGTNINFIMKHTGLSLDDLEDAKKEIKTRLCSSQDADATE